MVEGFVCSAEAIKLVVHSIEVEELVVEAIKAFICLFQIDDQH